MVGHVRARVLCGWFAHGWNAIFSGCMVASLWCCCVAGQSALLGFEAMSRVVVVLVPVRRAGCLLVGGCLVWCGGLLFENYIVDASIFWNLR